MPSMDSGSVRVEWTVPSRLRALLEKLETVSELKEQTLRVCRGRRCRVSPVRRVRSLGVVSIRSSLNGIEVSPQTVHLINRSSS